MSDSQDKFQDYSNRSLRTLFVLEALTAFSGPVTAQALGKVVDLPKQTLHRILNTLSDQGFLHREIDRSVFYPGPRLQKMGAGLLASAPSRRIRTAILTRLSADMGETCNLCIAETDCMIYLERVETDWPLRIQLPIGSRVPLHCTASGKLYLSTMNADQLGILLRSIELTAQTGKTRSDLASLHEELERTRTNGYGEDDEEFIDGMVAISVPVLHNDSGALLACLAVHGPSVRLSLDKLRDSVPRLQQASSDLSAALNVWKHSDDL